MPDQTRAREPVVIEFCPQGSGKYFGVGHFSVPVPNPLPLQTPQRAAGPSNADDEQLFNDPLRWELLADFAKSFRRLASMAPRRNQVFRRSVEVLRVRRILWRTCQS